MTLSQDTINEMQELADADYSAEQIMEQLGVSMSSIKKYTNLHGNEGRRKKEKIKKGTTKRKIDLMKLLGMDYVERRIK